MEVWLTTTKACIPAWRESNDFTLGMRVIEALTPLIQTFRIRAVFQNVCISVNLKPDVNLHK